MKQPIWNNRELVGYASSVKSAIQLLKTTLTIHPAMTLEVWERPEHIQEILQLPSGYVYSISYRYGN